MESMMVTCPSCSEKYDAHAAVSSVRSHPLVDCFYRVKEQRDRALHELARAHAELSSHGTLETWGPNPDYKPDVPARIAKMVRIVGMVVEKKSCKHEGCNGGPCLLEV